MVGGGRIETVDPVTSCGSNLDKQKVNCLLVVRTVPGDGGVVTLSIPVVSVLGPDVLVSCQFLCIGPKIC